MSDVFPIYGMRRKPYLTIGALVYSSAFMLYALAAIDNVVRLVVILFTRKYTVLLFYARLFDRHSLLEKSTKKQD
jgi:BT1 family